MGSKVAAMRGEDVPPPIKSEVRLKSELEELVRKTVEQCVTACAAVLALLTSVAAIFGRSLTLARTTTTDAATSPQQQQQQSKQSSDDDDEESEDECGIHVCEACWKDSPWSAEVDEEEEEFGREEESLEKRSRRKKWRSPTPPPPPRRVTRSKAKEEETEDDLLVFKDTRETLV